MPGASVFQRRCLVRCLNLRYARFRWFGGDHSPTLGKAVTRTLTFRPSHAVVLAPSSMAILLATVNAIRESSGHRFRQWTREGTISPAAASV